jgi:hypothetical protein
VIETDKKVITHINWLLIDIKIIARSVKMLQNRIVKVKIAGRNKTVKKLQSLLVKSHNARILAVKRVSENIGRNAVDIDSGITVSFSTYLRIIKRRRPNAHYMSLNHHLPLSILLYLCLDKVAFKLRPMDEEFGLLKIGSDSVEAENLVDVIDSAVLDSHIEFPLSGKFPTISL